MPAGVKGRMELGMGCIAQLILPCLQPMVQNGMDNHDETTLQGNMKKRDRVTLGEGYFRYILTLTLDAISNSGF